MQTWIDGELHYTTPMLRTSACLAVLSCRCQGPSDTTVARGSLVAASYVEQTDETSDGLLSRALVANRFAAKQEGTLPPTIPPNSLQVNTTHPRRWRLEIATVQWAFPAAILVFASFDEHG